MKQFLKFSMTLGILTIGIILFSTGDVHAVLQANPNTQYKTSKLLVTWLDAVRQMEYAGQAMGLTETRGEKYLSTESNGIDVHCVKSTEYGAMAILSTSGYGNPSNERVITTTTGNNTGVILSSTNWEWTAGVTGTRGISSIDERYYNMYSLSSSSAKKGDALGAFTATNFGCAGWHSAGRTVWPDARR